MTLDSFRLYGNLRSPRFSVSNSSAEAKIEETLFLN